MKKRVWLDIKIPAGLVGLGLLLLAACGIAFAGSNGVGTGGLQGFPAVSGGSNLADGGSVGGCAISNDGIIQCPQGWLGVTDAGGIVVRAPSANEVAIALTGGSGGTLRGIGFNQTSLTSIGTPSIYYNGSLANNLVVSPGSNGMYFSGSGGDIAIYFPTEGQIFRLGPDSNLRESGTGAAFSTQVSATAFGVAGGNFSTITGLNFSGNDVFLQSVGNTGLWINDSDLKVTIPNTLAIQAATSAINIEGSAARITWTTAGRYIDVNESNGNLRLTSLGLRIGGGLVTDSATAPTLTGGCTSPSMTWNQGSTLFQFDVGTSCTGVSTITINFETATNGYECKCTNTTAAGTRVIDSSGWSATTVQITNYSRTLGTAADFADGADIRCMCRGG